MQSSTSHEFLLFQVMADMGNGSAPPPAAAEKSPPQSPNSSAPKRKREGAENPVNPTQLSDAASSSQDDDHPLTQKALDPETEKQELDRIKTRGEKLIKELRKLVCDAAIAKDLQGGSPRKLRAMSYLATDITALAAYANFQLGSEIESIDIK
jgi:hypothetical protein